MSLGRLAVDATRGAGAGALATVPMSGVMLGAQQSGLMGQQPPEKTTVAAPDEHRVSSPLQAEDALRRASRQTGLCPGLVGALYAHRR